MNQKYIGIPIFYRMLSLYFSVRKSNNIIVKQCLDSVCFNSNPIIVENTDSNIIQIYFMIRYNTLNEK